MMTTCPLGGECGGTGWLWSPGRGYPDPEPPEWYPCECNPRAEGDPNELLDYRGIHARIAKAEATLRELARLWQSGCRDGMIAANWGCFSVEMDRIVEEYGVAPEPF